MATDEFHEHTGNTVRMTSELLIESPETPVAHEMRALVHECCPAHVAAHCERSFQFAAMLARADGVVLDEEVLFVGTILHDIGLSSRFAGTDRFEVRGADAARALLRETDWSPARSESVWDIIALHTSTGIAAAKSLETRYANRGISVDVGGRRDSVLDAAAVRAVLDRWPRASFPTAFAETIVTEVRTNPDSTRSTWMEHIAVDVVPGFRRADFLARLRSSVDFH